MSTRTSFWSPICSPPSPSLYLILSVGLDPCIEGDGDLVLPQMPSQLPEPQTGPFRRGGMVDQKRLVDHGRWWMFGFDNNWVAWVEKLEQIEDLSLNWRGLAVWLGRRWKYLEVNRRASQRSLRDVS